MLVITIFLSFCVLVTPVDIVEKKYSVDGNFFVDLNCDGDSPWLVTEYASLGVTPLSEDSARCIQATLKSCATLYPIDLSSGAVELNVYLQLFLNESALSVVVLDENNVLLLDYEYNRFSDGYTEGWNKVLLDLESSTVGYINLKASANEGDIILVDWLMETEYQVEQNLKQFDLKYDQEHNLVRRNANAEESFEQGSISVFTEANESETSEDPSSSTTTESDVGSTTDNSTESDQNPTTPKPTTPEPDSSSSQNNNFWSPIMIGIFVGAALLVFAITAVSAYYCGKMRATKFPNNDIVVDEDIKPEKMIPRVKTTASTIYSY